MLFDFAGAAKAGYTPLEIANYLGEQSGFDVAGARSAGYTDDDIIGHLAPPEPVAPPPVEGGFVPALKSATGQAIKGLGQVGVDYLGAGDDNALKQYGQGLIEENPTGIRSFSDIASRPGTAVKEAVGQSGPLMAGMLGARALGMGITAAAPLTGPAAPITAAIGQIIAWAGPTAVAALPSYSGIRDKQMLDSPEAKEDGLSKAKAALGAATVGLIETRFGPQNWALAAFTKEGRAAVAKKLATTTLAGTAAKGVLVGGAIEGAEELAQNPIEQLASGQNPLTPENIQETLFGGAMGAIGGGVLGGGTAAVLGRPAPVKQVLEAKDTDEAIALAEQLRTSAPVDTGQLVAQAASLRDELLAQENVTAEATAKAEYDIKQAALLHANRGVGEIVRTSSGEYYARNTDGDSIPLKLWTENSVRVPGTPSVTSAGAAALKAHYDLLGQKVVIFEDHPGLVNEGAFDPTQPDTLFVSSNPVKGAALVLGHEFKHSMESTPITVGGVTRAAGDFMLDFMKGNVTDEGTRHAIERFTVSFDQEKPGEGATPEEIAKYDDAFKRHIYSELAADFAAEAPKFATFVPRVVAAIEAQHGKGPAAEFLKSMLVAIEKAFAAIKTMFVGNETQSQNWVRNYEEGHAILAQMYATQYGTKIEQEKAKLQLKGTARETALQSQLEAERVLQTEPMVRANQALVNEIDTNRAKIQAADEKVKLGETLTSDEIRLRKIRDQLMPAAPSTASPAFKRAIAALRVDPGLRSPEERMAVEAVMKGKVLASPRSEKAAPTQADYAAAEADGRISPELADRHRKAFLAYNNLKRNVVRPLQEELERSLARKNVLGGPLSEKQALKQSALVEKLRPLQKQSDELSRALSATRRERDEALTKAPVASRGAATQDVAGTAASDAGVQSGGEVKQSPKIPGTPEAKAFLAPSAEKGVWYHGTAQDINVFKPKQAGAIFLTQDPKFAESFSSSSANFKRKNGIYNKTGENIMPVIVQVKNPFDPDNKAHVAALERKIGKKFKGQDFGSTIEDVAEGRWTAIENPVVQEAIKVLGHDGFYVYEGGEKNLAVYSSNQIKSATGNTGAFDPANPDIRYSPKFVDIDTLPRETQDDIFYTLTNEVRALKEVAESEFRGQVLDLVDPLVVQQRRAPLSSITMDAQRQASASRAAVEKYKELTTKAPPILVNGSRLVEGGHRYVAARERGDKTIDVVDVGPLLRMDWYNWQNAGEKIPSDAVRSNLNPEPPEKIKQSPKSTFQVNIGLKVEAGGPDITPAQARLAITGQGVKILEDAVHKSSTENTLVAHVDRPLTKVEGDRISGIAKQEAIAQYNAETNTGELFGPMADKWGPFDAKEFVVLDGRRLSEALAAGVASQKEAENAASIAIHRRGKYLVADQVELGQLIEEESTRLAPARTEDTDENRVFAANVIEAELRAALKEGGDEHEALGWYDHMIDKSRASAALKFPELATDDNAWFAFTYILAVTSNGHTIPENVENTFTTYAVYRRNKKNHMPAHGYGVTADSMQKAFSRWNDAVDHEGLAAYREFLLEKHPVATLKEYAPNMKEVVEQELYGGAVIGSKIGGGFLPNMNKRFDALTMDRWFMRTWGRVIGRLIEVGPDVVMDAKTRKFKYRVKEGGFSLLFATRGEATATARHTGNLVPMLINDPKNGGNRLYIRETMNMVLERMQKDYPALTTADLQAVLWYEEKALYEFHGVNTEDGTDYDNEIARHVETLGIKRSDIENARALAGQPARGDTGTQPGGLPEGSAQVRASPKPGGGTAGEVGRGDRPEVSAVGIHFSKGQRTTLDGAAFGTGYRGAEFARVQTATDARLKSRVYFYVDTGKGIRPEKYVGAHAHRADLTNLYDISVDPLNLVAGRELNDVESGILDAGYDGYLGREAGAAVLLGDAARVTPEYLGTDKAAYAGTPSVAPPAYSEQQLRAQEIARDASLPAGEMLGSEWMERLPETVGKLEAGQKYYRSDVAKSVMYSPKESFSEVVDRFSANVDAALANDNAQIPIKLSEDTPAALRMFGFSELPVLVRAGTDGVQKMHDSHGMTAAEIGYLIPDTLRRPAMILQYEENNGTESLRFVTNYEKAGRPIAVAVQPEKNGAHLVATVFPFTRGWADVRGAIKSGNLLYRDTGKEIPGDVKTAVQEAQKKYAREPRVLVGIIAQNPTREAASGRKYIVLSQSALVKHEVEGVKQSPKIVGDSLANYTAAEQEAMRNTGLLFDEKSVAEKVAEFKKKGFAWAKQGIFDQFDPIKPLSPFAYQLARLSKGTAGAFETIIKYGKLSLKKGVYDGDTSGGYVAKVLIPLHGEATRFLTWIAANRAELLSKENRENLFSAGDIATLKGLSKGTTTYDYTLANGKTTRNRAEIFQDAAKKHEGFNRNVLDMFVQSGLASKEAAAELNAMMYVPFFRDLGDENGLFTQASIKQGLAKQAGLQRLKGGAEKLQGDLLSNVLSNWFHMIDAGAKNRAARETLLAAESVGAAIEADAKTSQEMAKSMRRPDARTWFMDEGVKRFFVVKEPELLTALGALDYAGMKGPIWEAMGWFKGALTYGVTVSPFFKVRNIIRDSVQAAATADISYNIAGNVMQGVRATERGTQDYVSMLASGGLIRFGTMLENREADRVRQLTKEGVAANTILDSQGKVDLMWTKVKQAMEVYNELGNRGEEINRAALYQQLIKKGLSHGEAALAARDLLDFSMQGSFVTVRALTQLVPFFNARLQGMYKLGRATNEDKARMAIVIGAVSLLSLSLLAMFGDDDDWKKRSEGDRNNYWWFKILGVTYRLPKPFEIGAIATLAERGTELFFDKEMTGERFNKQVLAILGQQLAMNPIPQAFKPMIDIYANTNSFTGAPIEPLGMDKLQPDYRFTGRTSMAARAASTAGNAVTNLAGVNFFSPVQIDHMTQAYFGWLGTFVVGMTDTIARPLTGQASQPGRDQWKLATGNMISTLPENQSRYVSQVYEQAQVLEQAYGTFRGMLKQGKTAEAQEFLAENRDKIAKYGRVEAIKRAQSSLNEHIRIIESSRSMSPEDKRLRIQDLSAAKDRIARALAPPG